MAKIIARQALSLLTLSSFLVGTPLCAQGAGSFVPFPNEYKQGVHYGTVERGNIREELYVSAEAIAAAKKGEPLPDGTVILMEDFRDGKLYRYVTMDKTAGNTNASPTENRAGDWSFQSFTPDRQINRSESLNRCAACHQPQAKNDYVFTYGRMQSFNGQK